MNELWLKFQDENGEIKRVLVEKEKFVIGRHSENDLSIPNGKLSREHMKIDRFGDIFVVSDCDSSNGTTLNGENLTEPVALKNEDSLNLGGGLEIEIEVTSDDPNANANGNNDAGASKDDEENSDASVPSANSSSSAGEESDSNVLLWLLSVFGVFILIFAGGLLFVFSGNKEKERAKTDGGFVYSSKRDSTEDKMLETDETPSPKPTATTEISTKSPETLTNNLSLTSAPKITDASPQISNETDKIEQNVSSFMRRIAFNDPKPFLTSEQFGLVNPKIGQFKGSAALAENFKSVKKNAAQFEALASSKNLKPQFLAIAALTKIGNTRGDPLAVAQSMLPVLSELKGTLDNKLADENLLIIAGFARKQAGGNTALQNVIEGLSKSSQSENISPREVRTIWFLKKKDKITDAEFNFALQFLAIGVISQNPKNFNISSEPITF